MNEWRVGWSTRGKHSGPEAAEVADDVKRPGTGRRRKALLLRRFPRRPM